MANNNDMVDDVATTELSGDIEQEAGFPSVESLDLPDTTERGDESQQNENGNQTVADILDQDAGDNGDYGRVIVYLNKNKNTNKGRRMVFVCVFILSSLFPSCFFLRCVLWKDRKKR